MKICVARKLQYPVGEEEKAREQKEEKYFFCSEFKCRSGLALFGGVISVNSNSVVEIGSNLLS